MSGRLRLKNASETILESPLKRPFSSEFQRLRRVVFNPRDDRHTLSNRAMSEINYFCGISGLISFTSYSRPVIAHFQRCLRG